MLQFLCVGEDAFQFVTPIKTMIFILSETVVLQDFKPDIPVLPKKFFKKTPCLEEIVQVVIITGNQRQTKGDVFSQTGDFRS